MIMSSLAFTCALVCLVAVIAPGTSGTVRAAADTQVCSVGMLRGSYIWTFDGYTDLGGTMVPKAVMQGLRFNGDGTTFNTFGTVNIGGFIIIDSTGGVGTYTVAADCTGTISITDGLSFNMYVGPVHSNFGPPRLGEVLAPAADWAWERRHGCRSKSSWAVTTTSNVRTTMGFGASHPRQTPFRKTGC